MHTEKKEKTAEFKGAISLDAILASTSKEEGKVSLKTGEVLNKEPKVKEEQTIIEKGVGQEDTSVFSEKKENEPENKTVPSGVEFTMKGDASESSAYKTAMKLISLGLLEDFEIQVEEDGEPVKLSELKEMSEENLEEVISIHKQETSETISNNYISKEGLKEHQVKVIEILKNGGDLSAIASSKDKAFERPFEGYDLESQEDAADILYTDMVNGKGLEHEDAVTLIKKEVEKGTLKTSATKVFDLYRKAHSDYIDNKLEEQRKSKDQKELNFKENKKLLASTLKEAGLKETAYRKVVSEYGKKDENGDFALLNKLRDVLNKPEENHELILHLADKNLFNDLFKIKSAKETQRTIVKLATKVGSKGNRSSSKSTSTGSKAPWLQVAESLNNKLGKN